MDRSKQVPRVWPGERHAASTARRKRKEGLEFFGIKNSGGERERVRGEEERGETEGEK